jgi:hypothetical protein
MYCRPEFAIHLVLVTQPFRGSNNLVGLRQRSLTELVTEEAVLVVLLPNRMTYLPAL